MANNPTELCCPVPEMRFSWYVGHDGFGRPVLVIDDIACKCGAHYTVEHSDGRNYARTTLHISTEPPTPSTIQ